MPKLYSAAKIVKTLRRAGFYQVSQRGSHIKMRGFRFGKLQTVIVPFHKEIAWGTFQSIIDQAQMNLEEFKSYLR